MLRYPQIASSIANFAKKNPGGSAPLAPRRGSAPGPRWGLRPQTPAIGSLRSPRSVSQQDTNQGTPQTQDPQTYQLLLSPGSVVSLSN